MLSLLSRVVIIAQIGCHFTLPLLMSYCFLQATIAAFEQMKQEFEFNISASIHFDTQLNSSQSLQQVAQGIMKEVSEDLNRIQEFMGLLGYVGLFLLLLMYLQ